MNFVQRIEHWGDSHHPKWLDILRICFGLFLCFKGIQLLTHLDDLQNVITNKLSFGSFTLVVLSHFIVFAHLVGGFFLAIGLLTRIACMVQIPVLLGAILFVNSSGSAFSFSELIVSILALLLLVFFLIVGSGPWSVNRFIDMENSMHVNK